MVLKIKGNRIRVIKVHCKPSGKSYIYIYKKHVDGWVSLFNGYLIPKTILLEEQP